MAKTKYDIDKSIHDIAEGNKLYAGMDGGPGQVPAFVRMVVIEVVYDPQSIDDKKLDHWEHSLGVKNIRFGSTLPRNAIVAKRVLDGSAPASDPPMFLYPFFPSNLSLPVKPGEHVWVMFEHPDARDTEMGYWMCRITEPGFVDDVNHTHSPRQFDPSFNPSNKAKFDGKIEPKYEFRNGMVGVLNGERFTKGNTSFISGTETAYEDLLINSDASKTFQYEAVPRYRKRPGDYAIEGSNNSLIVLGTDRHDKIAEYKKEETGNVPKIPDNEIKGDAGSIDLVAGRGQIEKTRGKVATARAIDGGELWKELEKFEPSDDEGDPDMMSDRSRVRISQRTKVDASFGLDKFNVEFFKDAPGVPNSGLKDSTGDGAVVIKSDKVRIIARSDVEIVVHGFERDSNGKMKSSTDVSKWASIVVKSNGDIIFKPSEKGVIKLGGDDADLAVLCVKSPNGVQPDGSVVGAPITNNFGGVNGAGGQSGEWARKILVK